MTSFKQPDCATSTRFGCDHSRLLTDTHLYSTVSCLSRNLSPSNDRSSTRSACLILISSVELRLSCFFYKEMRSEKNEHPISQTNIKILPGRSRSHHLMSPVTVTVMFPVFLHLVCVTSSVAVRLGNILYTFASLVNCLNCHPNGRHTHKPRTPKARMQTQVSVSVLQSRAEPVSITRHDTIVVGAVCAVPIRP